MMPTDPSPVGRSPSRKACAPIEAVHERLAIQGDSQTIAVAIGEMWVDLANALLPVLGQQGVDSLLVRNLHLTARRHTWLAPVRETDRHRSTDAAALAALFAVQPPAIVMEAGSVFFLTLRELLATLVGVRQSEGLLLAAWARPGLARSARR